MLIKLKNKDTLIFDEFKFKCAIGKNGLKKNKIEGDKSTPKGIFSLGKLSRYRTFEGFSKTIFTRLLSCNWPAFETINYQ